jgi:hypothetical protein
MTVTKIEINPDVYTIKLLWSTWYEWNKDACEKNARGEQHGPYPAPSINGYRMLGGPDRDVSQNVVITIIKADDLGEDGSFTCRQFTAKFTAKEAA